MLLETLVRREPSLISRNLILKNEKGQEPAYITTTGRKPINKKEQNNMKEKNADTTATETAATENGRARLAEYKGQSVVKVIRLMGSKGWSAKQAREAFAKQGISPATNTLYIQLACGKKGVGKLAELTNADLEEMAGGKVKGAKKAAAKPATPKAPKAAKKAKAPVVLPEPAPAPLEQVAA